MQSLPCRSHDLQMNTGSWKHYVRAAARRAGFEITRYGGDKAPEAEFPFDLDEATVATIRAVRPYTLTSPTKIAGLCDAVRYVVQNKVPGDIVECGVWRGGSMMAVARTLLELDDSSRSLYLFDTFEGMATPGEHDLRHDHVRPEVMMVSVLGREDATMSMWCAASLEDVKQAFSTVGYPADKVHYVKGLVEETIPDSAPEKIAILRLDTDWYESTRHELEHLFPRLTPGGVLILDDYGFWLGARKAVDEYLEQNGVKILLNRLDEGRIGVVPYAD